MKQCDEEVIIDRYINGESRANLGKEYGVSTCTIDNIMKKYGIKPSDVLQKKDELIGEKFGRLTTISFVRKDGQKKYYSFKCDCGVTREFNIYGVKSGSIRSCGCSRRAVSHTQEEYIFSEYKKGRTCVDIASELGVSDFSIRTMMDRHDKKRRSNSESVRRIDLDETVFESLTRDSMYWLGFLGADGNIHGHNIKVELHPQDIDCLEKFKQFMKSGHSVRETKKGKYVAFTFSSPRVAKSLARFGVTPNKSLTFTPYEYCANNADFWRGMIDGDGTIRICKDGYLKISLCGSKPCMEAFSRWVQKNSCSNGALHKDRNIYKVMLSGASAKEIAHKLYANNPKYFLNRKAKNAEIGAGVNIAVDV